MTDELFQNAQKSDKIQQDRRHAPEMSSNKTAHLRRLTKVF